MPRRSSHATSLVLVALVAGCGGASPSAKTAASGGAASSSSIGDAALAAGGIGSAGGTEASAGSAPLASSLRADMVQEKVKLDGVPREWPARVAAAQAIEGTAGKTSASFGVQYDADDLWIAGEISDGGFTAGRDHASLVIAFPGPGGALRAHEIGLFPGKPGDSEGSVKWLSGPHKGAAVGGAKIIEAPTDGGVTFEARVPFSAFPEARTVRIGMRASMRYVAGGGKTILATGSGDVTHPQELGALPTEPEQSLLEGLLEPRGLSNQTPKFDLYADVTGDAMKERISVYGRFFTVCGPSYRGGKEFFFRDLGGDAMRLEARALTGRGKDDVLVRRRLDVDGSTREWLEIWSFGGDEPVTAFGHEILVSRGGKRVSNDVHMEPGAIEVAVSPAVGWDATSYKESTAGGVDPILLPWGKVASETYRVEGGKFVKVKEVPQAGSAPAAAPTPPQERLTPVAPPTPKERASKGDLAKQLFEQYRTEHGVAADTKPKTDLEVNVTGDARPERVVLIGRDLVILGPGYHDGRRYALLTLSQFNDAADIEELKVRDLTGDGAADLVVRGTKHVTAQDPKSPSAPPVAIDLEAMFVYQVKGDSITRIFAIETAREQGKKRVQGLVQFVPAPGGKTFTVDVRPGRATGWTQKTYPWGQDQPGAGALEPLLLPWGGVPSLRYVYDGNAFTLDASSK